MLIFQGYCESFIVRERLQLFRVRTFLDLLDRQSFTLFIAGSPFQDLLLDALNSGTKSVPVITLRQDKSIPSFGIATDAIRPFILRTNSRPVQQKASTFSDLLIPTEMFRIYTSQIHAIHSSEVRVVSVRDMRDAAQLLILFSNNMQQPP